MSTTNWKRLYGPTVTPDSSAHVILTAPANVNYVITKFIVSNVSGAAALMTIGITASGGALTQMVKKIIPCQPTAGGVIEIVELEGQILAAGDTLTFTDATGAALAPMISGVAYTP